MNNDMLWVLVVGAPYIISMPPWPAPIHRPEGGRGAIAEMVDYQGLESGYWLLVHPTSSPCPLGRHQYIVLRGVGVP